jgi:hypothetical protein
VVHSAYSLHIQGDTAFCYYFPLQMTDLTITLTKNRGDSLGIGFKKLTEAPRCEVSILVSNGVAAQSGLIREGDLLLSVNDVNVEELSPSEVGGVLARHSTDSSITLKIRRDVTTNGSASDIEVQEDDMEEEEASCHPTIIVEDDSPYSPTIIIEDSPSVSPDHASVSPVSDAPLERKGAPVTGWRGGQGGRRSRRSNDIIPEIDEVTSDSGPKPQTSLNLEVQQVAVKRHSLTPVPPKEEVSGKFAIRSSKSLDLANLPQWRAGSGHHNVVIHNLLDGTELTDRLHSSSIKVMRVPWVPTHNRTFLQLCMGTCEVRAYLYTSGVGDLNTACMA